MTYNRQQSDIGEVRDAISIDYASDKFLNVVTSNLGIRRPVYGFSDAVWRAVVKSIALRYKQVISAFEDVMSILLGPRVTQVALLAGTAEIDDTSIVVVDASNLPQTGTLVLDKGTASEETLTYVFIDYALNEIFLENSVTIQHDPDGVDTAGNMPSSPFAVDVVSPSLTATLLDTSQFPVTNYPYSVLLGAGTAFEETVSVTDNDTSTNVLTFASSTTKDHKAPRPTVIQSTLLVDYGAQALFLTLDDTSQFPEEGYVLLDATTIVKYIANDSDNNVLSLHRELGTSPTAGVVVELLDVSDVAAMAQVQVSGCGWQIYQVEPRRVEVLVDADCQDIRTLFNASYLHDVADAPVATTLSANANSGDLTASVVSTAGFPTRGVVIIGSSPATTIGYHLDDSLPNELVFDTHALADSYLTGDSVTLYQPVLSGDLVSGDVWHTDNVWPGPYVYSPGNDGPTFFRTTLAQYLAGTTYVALGVEDITNTAMEVEDASYFPTVWPFDIRVGRRTGNQEDLQVTAVYLRQHIRDTVSGVGSNPNELPCTGSAADFPHHKGYRVIIDRNGSNEEIAYVTSITGGHFVFENNLALSHSVGETVELVNDVLAITSFSDVHAGRFPASVRNDTHPTYGGVNPAVAEAVQVLYSEIEVIDGSSFETSATDVILNFGYSRVKASQPLSSSVTAGGTVMSFLDSSSFPSTSACPYFVKLGDGTYNEEIVRVTQNNIGLNQLSIDPSFPAHYDHPFGEIVTFNTADPEVIQFDERNSNTLRFSPAVVLESNHTIGELVAEGTDSSPSLYGTDFPFHIPSDILTRLKFLFDLIRAAGVEVEFIDRR